jgi:hypothetical protein
MKLEELDAVVVEAVGLAKFAEQYGKGRASRTMATAAKIIMRLCYQAQTEADRQEQVAMDEARDRSGDAYKRGVADTWTWWNSVKRFFWRLIGRGKK